MEDRSGAPAQAARASDAEIARGRRGERYPREGNLTQTAQSRLHPALLPSRAAAGARAALWLDTTRSARAAPTTPTISSSWPRARSQAAVKRRLGEIGDVAAIRFYRNCLSHTALRLAQDRRWHTLLAHPSRQRCRRTLRTFRAQRSHACLKGRQMLVSASPAVFASPPGPAIIVGSDIPRSRPNISRAPSSCSAAAMPCSARHWLMGLEARAEAARAVCWSALVKPHALVDTLANLKGRRVAFAVTLSDVDGKHDYDAMRGSPSGSSLIQH